MSVTAHVIQQFSTRSPAIFEECDRLMNELLAREGVDPTVRDATVSADAEVGLVEVEVTAEGCDEQDAEQAAVARIRAAVAQVVPFVDHGPIEDRGFTERDRNLELVTV